LRKTLSRDKETRDAHLQKRYLSKNGGDRLFSLALDNFTQVEADIRPIYEQSRQNKIPTHRIGMPYVVKFYAYLFVTTMEVKI
jgi:hypothetical protein